MTSVEALLRQGVKDLSDVHPQFAVVGGLAVSARAEPRLTRDVDFAIAVANDSVAESIILR